ncbi:MAG: phosphate ABC transporter permease subunit PstC [Armatimonadota bacterium]
MVSENQINEITSITKRRFGGFGDKFIAGFIFFNGITAILAMLLICIFLTKEALPLFSSVTLSEFLTGTEWDPLMEHYGILPLIVGSLFVTIGAIIISIPIGIICAIYLAEVAPTWLREILKPTIEILAGIPSVVLGFIGLTIVAPFLTALLNLPIGLTAITGSIALAFMAMPTIISISEDAIVAVPKAYRDGSLALGATKWETIKGVVVPTAKSGIIAACMLGVGRAVGETMTVLMVTGNSPVLPDFETYGFAQGALNYFMTSVQTMTATIALEMGEAAHQSLHYFSLFGIGLTLFAITFVINMIADLALGKSRR